MSISPQPSRGPTPTRLRSSSVDTFNAAATTAQRGRHSEDGGGEGHTVGPAVMQDGGRYYGTLRHEMPEGLGTCVWPDGSIYDGEWRYGDMNGQGTYVSKNGQRHDGEWKVGKDPV